MSVYNIAVKAIELINKQVESGKDIDGNSYAYSERPFYMPYSKKLAALFGKKNTEAFAVINKSGKLGMIISGGYKSIREVNNRATDGDFLQWSGEMLSALGIIKNSAFEATIGFNSASARKKAFWLNYSGVGKSRKLWKFFGLSKESLEVLISYAGNEFTIDENLEIMNK